jgi:hypothetical protein
MHSFKMMFLAAAMAVGLVSAAVASDADFKLVNKTGYQIDSVYVSAASSSNWGADIMGSNSVPDGTSVAITFPHGGSACKFDIKVKYNDGDTAEWTNVDLCQYETISLYWDGKQTRAVGE